MTGARSAGVTASVVVVFLGSAFAALSGAMLLFTAMGLGRTVAIGQVSGPSATFMRASTYGACVVMLGLAAWGVSTGTGLLRLRAWARMSMLVFAALLAVNGVFAGLVMVLLPSVSGMTPAEPEAISGLIYAIFAVLGGSWLYYFTRPAVIGQFGTRVPPLPGARPLAITIISWFVLLGGLACLGMAWFAPAIAFGLVFGGWQATAYYLASAGFRIWLGVGLLRLNPLSRVLGIVHFAYEVVNQILYLALPGVDDRMTALVEWLPGAWRGTGEIVPEPSILPTLLITIVVTLVPLWFLFSGRHAFRKAA